MDAIFEFRFRGKNYPCNAFIDYTETPCFIIVLWTDKGLIKEFGEELKIKTDCIKVLPSNDDTGKLVELRQAIFNSIKIHPAFFNAQAKYRSFLLKPSLN